MTTIPRLIIPEDYFYILGRGLVYSIKQPDPPIQLGEIIQVDDEIYKVIGIESHPTINGKDPGQKIGVLVQFIKYAPEESYVYGAELLNDQNN